MKINETMSDYSTITRGSSSLNSRFSGLAFDALGDFQFCANFRGPVFI